jgi:hypothetical protein
MDQRLGKNSKEIGAPAVTEDAREEPEGTTHIEPSHEVSPPEEKTVDNEQHNGDITPGVGVDLVSMVRAVNIPGLSQAADIANTIIVIVEVTLHQLSVACMGK